MIGRLCQPVARMTERFRPKPKKTTAVCRMYLDVKEIPLLTFVRSLRNWPATMPRRMEMIGPPMMGKVFPKNQDGRAMTRQSAMPGSFDGFMMIASSYCGNKRRSD